MKKINKFSKFNEASKLAAFGSKMRRIATGQSAGDEIQKLSDAQQQELFDMYCQDPMEAAKYLRSIIIKEKNSQFGLGLALAVAGAGMVYKASNMNPPEDPKPPKPDPIVDPPNPEPGPTDYTVQRGDSWWRIAKENLPAGSSNKDILAYTKQLAADNGAGNLYSGKFGSPGLRPDTWTSMSGGAEVPKSVISAADKLTTGEIIKITPFKASIPTIK